MIDTIKKSIESSTNYISKKTASDLENADSKLNHSIGLAQSAVLCMDLLSKHVYFLSNKTWLPKLLNVIDIFLPFFEKLITLVNNVSSESILGNTLIETNYCELLRLQGSMCISISTLLSSVGIKAVPHLSVFSIFVHSLPLKFLSCRYL
jgi:hypothetical protein